MTHNKIEEVEDSASPQSYNNLQVAEIRYKIKTLEHELRDTRDIARDTLHIVVGVDGKNGIRGTLRDVNTSVNKIKEDFLFLRETANNYKELKGTIGRFLLTSSLAFVLQFAGVIWFFAREHVVVEQLTVQLKKVIEDVEKINK
jgi:hypothetical protein